MNENEYAANLKEQCGSCSDISCKHSEDTPEVAFAYFSLASAQDNQDKE